MPETLKAACWSFAATDDPAANRARVLEGIATAAEGGARVLLVPECGLTGYPSAARTDLSSLDWSAVAEAERELADRAREAGLVLVLGTASRSGEGATNDALACGAVESPVRYRKRSLTPVDKKHFVPGREPVLVEHAGWRFGLAICYDLRFPRVFAELSRAGADAFLVIAHLAGPEPEPGTKARIMPAHCASRSGEWATPLLLCNTAAADRWLDSGHWDARGLAGESAGDGLLVVSLTPREGLPRWYTTMHADAHASFFAAEESP